MIRAYCRGDAFKVLVQREQEEEAVEFRACFDEIEAYSLIGDCKEVLAVFGFWEDKVGGGRWCVALFGRKCKMKMVELVRFLKKEIPLVMKQRGYEKVMMTVRKGFGQGERLAEMLGFELRGKCPRFYLDYDYQLFERNEK